MAGTTRRASSRGGFDKLAGPCLDEEATDLVGEGTAALVGEGGAIWMGERPAALVGEEAAVAFGSMMDDAGERKCREGWKDSRPQQAGPGR